MDGEGGNRVKEGLGGRKERVGDPKRMEQEERIGLYGRQNRRSGRKQERGSWREGRKMYRGRGL